MPPNLVNFGLETAENGWRVFAHPPKFWHCETLQAWTLCNRQQESFARVMQWHV